MQFLLPLHFLVIISFSAGSSAVEQSSPIPLALEAGPVAGSTDLQCKAVPGSTKWPSAAEWANLNQTVQGRLLKPDPPAASCHLKHPAYSLSACLSLKLGWWFSGWHSQHPTSSMWQNHNNYSCVPDGSKSCSNDGYPVYVVEAREAGDVKAAVDFARTRNIRLNIKSTGHDFLGR
jgi:hypothetical protein